MDPNSKTTYTVLDADDDLTYHQRQKVDYDARYTHLQPALEEIARQHSEYGYCCTAT